MLVLPTNESWFLDSAAIYMHAAQAVMRSVESGRYMVRAASTGVSCIITPSGRVVDELGVLKTGIVIGQVYPQSTRTLYSHIGNTWVYLMMAFGVSVGVIEKVKIKNLKKS